MNKPPASARRSCCTRDDAHRSHNHRTERVNDPHNRGDIVMPREMAETDSPAMPSRDREVAALPKEKA